MLQLPVGVMVSRVDTVKPQRPALSAGLWFGPLAVHHFGSPHCCGSWLRLVCQPREVQEDRAGLTRCTCAVTSGRTGLFVKSASTISSFLHTHFFTFPRGPCLANDHNSIRPPALSQASAFGSTRILVRRAAWLVADVTCSATIEPSVR